MALTTGPGSFLGLFSVLEPKASQRHMDVGRLEDTSGKMDDFRMIHDDKNCNQNTTSPNNPCMEHSPAHESSCMDGFYLAIPGSDTVEISDPHPASSLESGILYWCPLKLIHFACGIVNHHGTPICKSQYLKSRLLAFPIVNATYRTRFSRFTIPKREKLQLQIPMATQVGELPDVVTYPIAHELDPPPMAHRLPHECKNLDKMAHRFQTSTFSPRLFLNLHYSIAIQPSSTFYMLMFSKVIYGLP